jgi:RNA polymerase sigma factor (TIGR02999 family)
MTSSSVGKLLEGKTPKQAAKLSLSPRRPWQCAISTTSRVCGDKWQQSVRGVILRSVPTQIAQGLPMNDVTRILSAIEQGDSHAAERLLPLVYDELRKLAAQKLAQEKPGQTLQATALVHEAYLRLVGAEPKQPWDSRGHFFAAAAEAMRRILVEDVRRKRAVKHGGQVRRLDIDVDRLENPKHAEEILAVDEALAKLARENPPVAKLVNLRYFAGMTLEEASTVLRVSVRTAHRYWNYARAWLHQEIGTSDSFQSPT